MIRNLISIITIFLVSASVLFAGNPDRQGEAGAFELLMNPWARSAGLHTMNTSSIMGVEAIRLNPAGISRVQGTEIVLGHTIYLSGADIGMNAAGLAQKMKNGGAFGISIMALDLGEIAVTTEDAPEGTGATFSPNFVNIGFSYAHLFENKISVGATFRAISESTSDLQAFGFAIDAGVQYVSGENDEFKFGISLRNVGTPMAFRGEGLAVQLENPNRELPHNTTFNNRGETFELPSVLNIGLSYDFLLGGTNKLSVIGNFTSNSFSEDQYGVGAEFTLNERFQLRAGYRLTNQSDQSAIDKSPLYTGLAAGVSVLVPFKKDGDSRIGFDYGYRASRAPFDGSHSLSVRMLF